jgi:Na+/H+-dicarboxylate symporter
MSSGTRVILALLAGLAGGAAFAALEQPALGMAVGFLEPIGVLWLNALRMTVVPLVVALLITGIASAAETARTGRTAALTFGYFLLFLTVAALLAAVVLPLVLDLFPVQRDAAAAVRASLGEAGGNVPVPPPASRWLEQLVPTNPFAAAANDAMLPLMVFALLFGFAASRVESARREPLLAFFHGVVDTMLVLVGWILFVAPLGVFALALGVGYRSGVGAAGALGYYVVLMSGLCVLVMLLLYPVAVVLGRVGPLRFAKAAVPSQVVAVSTQSSLASLPAMLAAARSELGIAQRVAGLVLPLAVSLFRVTSPPVNLAIVIFVAHVYAVPLGPTQMAAGVAVAVITSLAVVGLPSQLTFFTTTVPIAFAMGVPTELLALLIALEVIPDIFRTVANVTGDLAVAVIVARHSGAA